MDDVFKCMFYVACISFHCNSTVPTGNMERDLKDKTVVVTGAATGLGYEIADNFLKKNAKLIIILDINEEFGNEAVKKLNEKHGKTKAYFMKCDVTQDLQDVYGKIIATFKKVDVLVNNAGILNESALQKTIDINVTALIQWSLKFFEHMRRDKSGNGGTIINLASIYGYRLDPYLPIYRASKFAVMGFTKSLGHMDNFKKFGVRVVAICPGFTKTELVSDVEPGIPEQANDFKEFLKRQLWQNPDAVGKAAVDVFEASDSGTAWLIEGAKPITQV